MNPTTTILGLLLFATTASAFLSYRPTYFASIIRMNTSKKDSEKKPEIVADLQKAAENAKTNVVDGAKAAQTAVVNGAKSAQNAVGGALEDAKDFAKKKGTDIKEGVAHLGDNIKEHDEKAAKKLEQAKDKAVQGAKDLAAKGQEKVHGALGDAADKTK